MIPTLVEWPSPTRASGKPGGLRDAVHMPPVKERGQIGWSVLRGEPAQPNSSIRRSLQAVTGSISALGSILAVALYEVVRVRVSARRPEGLEMVAPPSLGRPDDERRSGWSTGSSSAIHSTCVAEINEMGGHRDRDASVQSGPIRVGSQSRAARSAQGGRWVLALPAALAAERWTWPFRPAPSAGIDSHAHRAADRGIPGFGRRRTAVRGRGERAPKRFPSSEIHCDTSRACSRHSGRA